MIEMDEILKIYLEREFKYIEIYDNLQCLVRTLRHLCLQVPTGQESIVFSFKCPFTCIEFYLNIPLPVPPLCHR